MVESRNRIWDDLLFIDENTNLPDKYSWYYNPMTIQSMQLAKSDTLYHNNIKKTPSRHELPN